MNHLSGQQESPPVITMKDIAKRCGVSVATVSRALRDSSAHSETTTKHIREIAAQMGYDPSFHQGARRLVSRRFGKRVKNHVIALLVPPYYYQVPYFTRLQAGILDVLTPEGISLLTVNYTSPHSEFLPSGFSFGDVDGVLLYSDPQYLGFMLARLSAYPTIAHCPIVSMMSGREGGLSVLPDFRTGSAEAVGYLLDIGHRHLLHYHRHESGQPVPSLVEREEGYRGAFIARGLDSAEYLHHIEFSEQFWQRAYFNDYHYELADFALLPELEKDVIALREILVCRPEITAILTPNDPFAILIWRFLKALGKSVPRDYSLIGFDDTDPLPSDIGPSSLTTIQVPLEEIGRAAARLALEESNEPARIVLPTRLVVRATAAPPRME